jgi:hypothetical protein
MLKNLKKADDIQKQLNIPVVKVATEIESTLFDRPPSTARILGVEWLANLLYPQYVNLDINKEIKDFYKNFYNYNLTDEEVQDLVKNATAK